jgi:multidrug efflux system outer membrane protein
MAGVTRLAKEQEAVGRQVDSSQAALVISRRRYRAGYSSYLDQLDSERSLLDARRQLLDLRLSRLTAIVALYLSLGGGWKLSSPSPT